MWAERPRAGGPFAGEGGFKNFENKQTTHSIDPLITINDLENALKNLNNNAAPGFDGITNKVIKNLPEIVLQRILNLFNKSIDLGHIPKKWKQSKV